MIYKKLKGERWQRHHIVFDTLKEELEFVEFLRELYPNISWVSLTLLGD
jgi:hypothetical protein